MTTPDPAHPAGAVTAVEIETKFDVDADRPVPDLAPLGLGPVTSPIHHELDATYYDTPDLRLLTAHVTLRRRSGGDDAGWHLKRPAGEGARTELRYPLTDGLPEPLRRIVFGTGRGQVLVPVAHLANQRRVVRVLAPDGGMLVELADDHVTATPLVGPGVRRAAQWREWEVELGSGSPAEYAAVLRAVTAAGGRPAAKGSKLERALAPSVPAIEVEPVPAALGRLRSALLADDRSVREGQPAAIGRLRSVARAIAAVVAVFAPVPPVAADPLRAGLRDLRRELAPARALVVSDDRILAGLATEAADSSVTEPIRALSAQRTTQAWATLIQYLESAPYLRTLTALDELISAAGPGRDRATALAEAWAKVPPAVRVALRRHGADAEAMRTARRAVAFVRDALLATAGVDRRADAAAEGLTSLAAALRDYHDAVLTTQVLTDLAFDPSTDGAGGFVLGRLHAMQQLTARRLLGDVRDVYTAAHDRLQDLLT